MNAESFEFAPSNRPADRRRWQRVLDGDRHAYAEFVRVAGRIVYGAVFQVVGDAQNSEVIFTDAVVRAYDRRKEKPKDLSFSAWLLDAPTGTQKTFGISRFSRPMCSAASGRYRR